MEHADDARRREEGEDGGGGGGGTVVGDCDYRVSRDENDIEMHNGMPIRLSKRMWELGMCSKREAADILREVHDICGGVGGNDDFDFTSSSSLSSLRRVKEVIYLRGKPVLGGAAVKVPPGERFAEIRSGNDPPPSMSMEDRRRWRIVVVVISVEGGTRKACPIRIVRGRKSWAIPSY